MVIINGTGNSSDSTSFIPFQDYIFPGTHMTIEVPNGSRFIEISTPPDTLDDPQYSIDIFDNNTGSTVTKPVGPRSFYHIEEIASSAKVALFGHKEDSTDDQWILDLMDPINTDNRSTSIEIAPQSRSPLRFDYLNNALKGA